MACTGHDWEQIDSQWDVPRLLNWNRYSRQFPPLHALVARYLDYKPAEDTASLTTEQHAERLLGALGVIT